MELFRYQILNFVYSFFSKINLYMSFEIVLLFTKLKSTDFVKSLIIVLVTLICQSRVIKKKRTAFSRYWSRCLWIHNLRKPFCNRKWRSRNAFVVEEKSAARLRWVWNWHYQFADETILAEGKAHALNVPVSFVHSKNLC